MPWVRPPTGVERELSGHASEAAAQLGQAVVPAFSARGSLRARRATRVASLPAGACAAPRAWAGDRPSAGSSGGPAEDRHRRGPTDLAVADKC